MTQRFARRTVALALALAGALACLPARAGAEVKIGVLLPLSGKGSAYGQHQEIAMKMALEELEKTGIKGEPVKLFGGRAVNGSGEPGTVIAAGKTLQVAAAVGAVEVQEIQPAGKKRMPVAALVSGRGIAVGDRFA